MLKYVISVISDNVRVYYAGKHYEASGAFSSNIYHATLFTEGVDAGNMKDVLDHRFHTLAPFSISPVRITIQELIQH